jgi:excisionase family DNA binding protein
MESGNDRSGELSLFIGVEEAARMLGISRSLAYELANRWIATDRAEGIPAVRLGRRLLVSRAGLERMANDVS